MSAVEHWISVTAIGSSYEVEMNVNAAPGAPDRVKYRHREAHPFAGLLGQGGPGYGVGTWKLGKPPATEADA